MASSAASQKSAEAFRTISEVADALKLPPHVLRFWETRFTQIKPLKRAGGRRFYRPEDIELLGAIRLLLYGEGYTIKGVQRILREQGPRAVAALAQRRGPTSQRPGQAQAGTGEAADSGGPVQDADLDGDPADLLQAALADLAECRRILTAATAS